MDIKILCVGINYYFGIENLKSCINDSNDWVSLLREKFHVPKKDIVKLNLGYKTDKENIIHEFKELIKNLKDRELGLFIFSGHGNQQKLIANNQQIIQETIRVRNGFISEIELQKILKDINPKAYFVSIIDSCYSGGISFKEKDKISERKDSFLEIKTYENKTVDKILPNNNYLKIFRPINKNFVSISACESHQLAYGDIFEERMNSALTYYAIKIIEENPEITYISLISKLKDFLPNSSKGYYQTPNLSGNDEIINKKLFNL